MRNSERTDLAFNSATYLGVSLIVTHIQGPSLCHAAHYGMTGCVNAYLRAYVCLCMCLQYGCVCKGL